jgi:hypothetical protein
VDTAKQIAGPGAANVSVLSERYSPTWYRAESVYDEADRPIGQTTGAETSIAGLQGASTTIGSLTSTSLVSVTYDDRDIPIQVGGSYGALVTNEVHYADGCAPRRRRKEASKAA